MSAYSEWYKNWLIHGFSASDARYDARYVVQNGFENKDEVLLSFVEGTRTFTISPASTAYFVWCGGKRIPKTVAESIVIPDTEGLHYVYFDGTGVITKTMAFSESLILVYTFIAVIYWDATNKVAVLVGDERHGRVMDSQTHLYHHQTEGAKWASGMQPANITIGNGSANAHAQLSVGAGSFWDEDLLHTFLGLNLPADIPFLYRSGAAGDWRTKAATGFVCTNVAPGERAAYNQWTGATWQLTQVAQSDFLLMHLIATNDITNRLRWVVGQNAYTTLANAREGAATEWLALSMGPLSMLTLEFVVVATFILQTANGYSNTVKARLQGTGTGGQFIDWRRAPINAPGIAPLPGAAVAGQVIQEVVNTQAGGTTASTSFTNLTSTAVVFTPKSSNSWLVVECSFYGYDSITGVIYADIQIYMDGSPIGAPTSIGSTASDMQVLSPGMQRAIVSNSDLADKSFQMYGKNSAAGGTSMSVGNQVWTIREIQR